MASRAEQNKRLRELERRLTPRNSQVLFCLNQIPSVPREAIIVRMNVKDTDVLHNLAPAES